MSYYLQMDGVDDKIATPSLTFNKIEMDFISEVASDNYQKYVSSNFEYFQRNGGHFDNWSGNVVSVLKNGVTQSNSTLFVDLNIRTSYTVNFNTITSKPIYVFNNMGSGGFLKGKIFSIKIYNGTVLVAYYDMTLGNVIDQSGNGNHATLTGGTWVKDVSSGTLGSIVCSTKQIISNQSSANATTKQTINQSGYNLQDIKQIIYGSNFIDFPVQQDIYETRSIDNKTLQTLCFNGNIEGNIRQVIFNNTSGDFITTQAIIESGNIGAVKYATFQTLCLSTQFSYPVIQKFSQVAYLTANTIQNIFLDSSNLFLTNQDLYSQNLIDMLTRQIFYDNNQASVPIKLNYYKFGSIFMLTQQNFGQHLIIGEVFLLGELIDKVYLGGSQQRQIILRGNIMTKKNQNFEMYAGDSKNLIISITDNNNQIIDLTGSNARWVLKNISTTLIEKDNQSGIIFTNPQQGEITISLNSQDTKGLSGAYIHAAEIIDSFGNVSTVMTGLIKILPDII